MNNRLLVKSSKYRIWPTPPDSEDEKKKKTKPHYLRRSFSQVQNRFQQMFDGR